MTKSKSTKGALLASALSILLCIAMLISSTFAWFTDSAQSGKNKIVAGNLDVELEYRDADGKWQPVTESVKLFSDLEADGETENLWEPGHTEVVYLKISNLGKLALNYKLSVNIANEKPGTNLDGETFKLSDNLVFGQVESADEIAKYATREEAWEAAGSALGLKSFSKSSDLLSTGSSEYVALIVYMPTTVGNEANYKTGSDAPEIELGISLFATQASHEEDSFNSEYDRVAALLSNGYAAAATAEDLNAALKDGKNVVLTDDITVAKIDAPAGTIIDGNGKTITGTNNLSLSKNVEYKNTEFALDGGWGAIVSAAKFTNCTFNSISPYLFPAEGNDIVIDGCTFVNTTLQICYNEGGNKPESCKTIITNNTFIVNNTDVRAHAIVLGGGSSEFWAGGAETVTIKGNTFTPNNSDTSYIAYYIYGNYNETLTSVPVYSDNTFNGDANYSINSTEVENQHTLGSGSETVAE